MDERPAALDLPQLARKIMINASLPSAAIPIAIN
jgi:hypothetical protein